MSEQKSLGIGIYRRQQLEGEVIYACGSCGAGGVYHDVVCVNVGCYDPTRKGQFVGEICPNCGSERSRPEPRGVMWSCNFYPASTPKWLMKALEWINRR